MVQYVRVEKDRLESAERRATSYFEAMMRANGQNEKLRGVMRLYLDAYERYFATSGDDEPMKTMAKARRQMRVLLGVEDQYPDRDSDGGDD